METVVIRALWGDSKIVTLAKTLQDIEIAERWRHHLRFVRTVTVAYGNHNADSIRRYGYDPILAEDNPLPAEWSRFANPTGRRDPWGRSENGLSMWWRKLHAIRLAWDYTGAKAIIWLDWDTIINRRLCKSDLRHFTRGPVYQGRLRQYKTTACHWRKENRAMIYHGGCFYMRDRAWLDRVIAAHVRICPHFSDEQAMTWTVDDRLRGKNDPALHRAKGYDSPTLYSARHNVVPSTESAVFSEGRKCSLSHRVKIAVAAGLWK